MADCQFSSVLGATAAATDGECGAAAVAGERLVLVRVGVRVGVWMAPVVGGVAVVGIGVSVHCVQPLCGGGDVSGVLGMAGIPGIAGFVVGGVVACLVGVIGRDRCPARH